MAGGSRGDSAERKGQSQSQGTDCKEFGDRNGGRWEKDVASVSCAVRVSGEMLRAGWRFSTVKSDRRRSNRKTPVGVLGGVSWHYDINVALLPVRALGGAALSDGGRGRAPGPRPRASGEVLLHVCHPGSCVRFRLEVRFTRWKKVF